MLRFCLLFSLLFSLGGSLHAQTFEFLPGTTYDSSVPTLRSVVGHDWGEKITTHQEAERYLQALQQALPARTRLIRYGETWQGRSLYILAVGSPETIARLDRIQAGMAKLADPRRLAANEASTLIETLPSTVWLICGVHGNEISSVDAGLLTAYHLLAAREEKVARLAAANTLVFLDPMQNPDGRDRFIHYFRQNLGRFAQSDLQSAEHNEVWPSGRVNHYLFDMNRDWFAQTQPETRGRAQFYLNWFPQVVADLHEMGTQSSYYFAPPALPWNPNLTKMQTDWLTRIGQNNAAWFDRFGFDYYTRENYDSFYPGYGEGWPLFHGSLGMTYEQASVRGLLAERDDETVMSYRDSVHHHFIAALSTVETTATQRQALLRHFYEHRRTAIEEGKTEAVKEYILTAGQDPNRAARLAGLLMRSGIEVRQAQAAFRNPRTRDYDQEELLPREFPAGTYLVRLDQPAKRLAKTLLDRRTLQDKEFLDEQQRRNRLRQREQFYDVTAWSLPYLFDLPCYQAEQVSEVASRLLTEIPVPAGSVRGGPAKLAYLIPWGTQSAAAALAALFLQDIRVHSTDRALTLAGRAYPAGTLIVKVKDNPADLHDRLKKIAVAHGVEIDPTDSAWVEAGPNFGSSSVRYLKRPRVALVYHQPTRANSAGWVRYVIEQRYGYPVTTLRADQLRSFDLRRYDVIILPDVAGSYTGSFGDGAFLREWVQRGGTLIGLAGAVNWLAEERVNLLATRREKREKEKEGGKSPAAKDGTVQDPVEKAIEPVDEYPSETPGALLRVRVNREHWLGFGYGETTTVMVESDRIFSLLKLDRGTMSASISRWRRWSPAGTSGTMPGASSPTRRFCCTRDWAGGTSLDLPRIPTTGPSWMGSTG
ncbi:MAG: M14 family metallopeptidase [Blastocatellia bacterium]